MTPDISATSSNSDGCLCSGPENSFSGVKASYYKRNLGVNLFLRHMPLGDSGGKMSQTPGSLKGTQHCQRAAVVRVGGCRHIAPFRSSRKSWTAGFPGRGIMGEVQGARVMRGEAQRPGVAMGVGDILDA